MTKNEVVLLRNRSERKGAVTGISLELCVCGEDGGEGPRSWLTESAAGLLGHRSA